MNQSSMTVFFSNLLAQSPILLVYVGGIVLCIVMWRRSPMGAMLAVVGLGLMLATALGQTLISVAIITGGAAPATSRGQALVWVGIAAAVMRAFGLALVLAGVFADRPPLVARSGFEVQPSPPPIAP